MSVYIIQQRQTCLSLLLDSGNEIKCFSAKLNLITPVGVETAPENFRALLEEIPKSFKFIPNHFGALANDLNHISTTDLDHAFQSEG